MDPVAGDGPLIPLDSAGSGSTGPARVGGGSPPASTRRSAAISAGFSLGCLAIILGGIVSAYGYMRSMVQHFDAHGNSYWAFETNGWFVAGMAMLISGVVLIAVSKLAKGRG